MAVKIKGQLNFLSYLVKVYKQRGLPFRDNPLLGNKPILQEYDFIVVGAGPAGCVLTHRLTEVAQWKVLLLEAGLDDSIYSDIPLFNTYFLYTEHNWNYLSEYQETACQGMVGKRCPWPAGKGMGGGTIINALIYTRGNKYDFDHWASLGNKGWSYEEVLPYFIKSEQVLIPQYKNSTHHGHSGLLGVDFPPFHTPIRDAFMEAGREVGYEFVDYHDPDTPVGFSPIQATMTNGRRNGASRTFLHSIKQRKNFHVVEQAHVTKILIDPMSKRAYGVEFIKKGRKRKVFVRKEVILAAGAFNTPQILMLSGIGHKDHLEEMGIPVIKNSPVGDNLQEHISMAGLAFMVNQKVGVVTRRYLQNIRRFALDWIINKRGPWTSLGCEALGFIKTKYANDSKYPDIEYIFLPVSLGSDGGASLRVGMGVSDEMYNAVWSNISELDAWSIWPMILYPKSRGKVRLQNTNPLTPPKLYPNFLTHQYDIDVLSEALRLIVELSKTKAFQKLGSVEYKVRFPGCVQHEYGSRDYWACTVRYLTTQLHHQCGTAKMGLASDPGAVVDPALRVYGVSGLRVADTSIMPTITGGHTMAPAYMIGEKAADMIKDTWLQTIK
ncbi:glucose dehydrogenase [FAD, quinone]-like [Macrosteles quadrilineatus]|uniref:glucose dehydrogenase [FAD, quinone]-like n=1 Tax=Macrosteles quadrilineatus TaxID=74068 RepID=UPI0023E1AEDC|nr:glucose dehydrogenase [FAD, quinone]-like [Macrosteles quadrilineatus]